MSKRKVQVSFHPDLDYGFFEMGGAETPTKQDKFKALKDHEVILEEDGKQTNLSDQFELYIKKKGSDGSEAFQKELKKSIGENLTKDCPFPLAQKVEVYISVSMDEKRIANVDIDNLAKFILDCMKGLVFEDDVQVQSLLVTKDVNPFMPINSIMIGVRKINSPEDSWFKNVKLLIMKDVSED